MKAIGDRADSERVEARQVLQVPTVALSLAVALAYFAAARLGLALLTKPENVAVFWPASGISVGVLIGIGAHARKSVAAGVMLATVVANLLGDRNAFAAIVFALCNAGETLLTAWLVEHWYGPNFRLVSLRRVLYFLAASLIGPAVAAVIATVAIEVTGVSASSVVMVWEAWFTSDAIGIATIAPFVIGVLGLMRDPPLPRGLVVESLALLVALAFLTAATFSLPTGPLATVAPTVVVFPALLLLAGRGAPVFAAAAVGVIGIIVVTMTTLGVGHLGDPAMPLRERVVAAQLLLLASTLAALMLSALFEGRKRAEAELNASEARYRSVVEGSLQGIAVSQDERIVYANRAMAHMFGYTSPEELIGKMAIDDFIGAQDREALRTRTRQAYLGEAVEPHPAARAVRKDGNALSVATMAHTAQWKGRPAAVSFYLDVTERERSEARQRMLTRELDHRVKNTLAQVLIIIQRSAEGVTSVSDLTGRIEGRIQALAQAHSLLSQKNWHGADLRALVGGELEPYATPTNTTISGASLTLKPEAALAICLVVHELATNAAKYGSYMVAGGKVSISWHVDAGESPNLIIDWLEVGGPPVEAPARTGYGSSVIDELIPYEVGGQVKLDYGGGGVCCRISIPLARVAVAQWT